MNPSVIWLSPVLAANTFSSRNMYWFRRSLNKHREPIDWENPAECNRIERWLTNWLYRNYYTRGEPDAAAAPVAEPAVALGFSNAIAAAAGDKVKTKLNYSPGFMMVRSRGLLQAPTNHQQIRIYCNAAPQHADRFVAGMVEHLLSTGWDFLLKILNDPDAYTRADSSVLYLQSIDASDLDCFLNDVHRCLGHYLRSATPAMTRRLGMGLAVAESPDEHGTSFGMNRCALLASGLISGRRHRSDDWEARASAVANAFAKEGLDVARPYLGAGRPDCYRRVSSLPPPKPAGGRTSTQAACSLIFEALNDSAIGHEKACTWWKLDQSTASPNSGFTSRPIGADVYSGSTGVALFLAEAADQTGNQIARSLAARACQGALDDLDAGALEAASGLYSGALGALFGIALVAERLKLEALTHRVLTVLDRALDKARKEEPLCLDLLAGRAGDVLALLGLARLLDAPDLIEVANAFGQQLVTSAQWSDGAASWATQNMPTTANLTGFSHGTAGISLALMELYEATGTTAFRDTAHAGFKYEHRAYDANLQNWPDFRRIYRHQSSEARLVRTNTAWCHGAAGIALSRLIMLDPDCDAMLRDDAQRALAALRRSVRSSLDAPDADLGLCHGLAGNATILARARGTQFEATDDASLVARSQAEIARRVCAAEKDTLCGNPGLMVGISGLGWFLAAGNDIGHSYSPLWFSTGERAR